MLIRPVTIATAGALACATLTGAAAGAPLYSNASANPAAPALAPAPASLSGAAPPPGLFWSEVPSQGAQSNAVAGFSAHDAGASGAFRIADDVFVTHRYGWNVSALTVYAYKPGGAGPGSPIAAMRLRVWNGRPGDAGSAVIWGDASTNVLTSSAATQTLRIFNSVTGPFPLAPDASRVIWSATAATPGLVLAPGHYWFDWQLVGADPQAALHAPAATVAGSRTLAGWNARLFRNVDGGLWVDLVDAGKPSAAPDVAQDLPFLLVGDALPALCPGDTNGDNLVNFTDLNVVLSQFGQAGAALSGDLNSDGLVNFTDLNIVLSNFGAAC